MYQKQALGNRLCALALAVMLLVGMVPTNVFAADVEQSAKDDAALIADNYELTAEEEAILTSGGLISNVHQFTAPADGEALISVDEAARKITAENYKNNGYTWTPKTAYILVNEQVLETVTVWSGNTCEFTYTGDQYTVKVDYQCEAPVAIADQLALLNNLYVLTSAMEEMNQLLDMESFLDTFGEEVNGPMYTEMLEGKPYSFVMFGQTVSDTIELDDGDAKDALQALKQQCVDNGGTLDLSNWIDAYKAASDKLRYIKDNGSDIKASVAETYGYLNTLLTEWKNEDGALNKMHELLTGMSAVIRANGTAEDAPMADELDQLAKDMATALGSSELTSIADTLKELQNAPWTLATGSVAFPIKDGYNLTSLVEAAIGKTKADYSAIATKENLLMNTTSLQVNVNLKDVVVTVVANVVLGKDNATTTSVTSEVKQELKFPVNTTLAAIEAAITIRDAAFAELAEKYGVTAENYTVATENTVGDKLTENATYTIVYTPKNYTITYDFETELPVSVPYGYTMTLPACEEDAQVYDYLVNGDSKLQSEEIVITGDTEIKRTQGKAWTVLDLTAIAAANVSDATVKKILSSTAIKSNVIRIRYPDAGRISVTGSNPFTITAPAYPTSVEGLNWTATTGVVQPSGETITFVNNQATVNGAFTSVDVTFQVEVTSIPNTTEMLGVMNLPFMLKQEYEAQTAEMQTLCGTNGNSTLMNGLAELTESNLNRIDLIKHNLATEEAKKAVTFILGNCVNPTTKMLKLYDVLSAYVTDGMGYYYKGTNYETLRDELNTLKPYIDAIVSDPNLESVLVKAELDVEYYMTRLQNVRNALLSANLDDKAPNAVIDRSASLDNLKALGQDLAKVNAQPCTKLPSLYMTTTDMVTAPNMSSITITVEQKNSAGTTIYTQSSNAGHGLIWGTGHVLAENDLAMINAVVAELQSGLSEKDLYVKTGSLPGVGTVLNASKQYTLTWSPKTYTVQFQGADESSQSFPADNREITLPVCGDAGYYYNVTIDGTTIRTGAENNTYSFTKDQLALFTNGTLSISVEKIHEGRQNIQNLIGEMNDTLAENNVTEAAFILTENAANEVSIVLRLSSAKLSAENLLNGIVVPLTGSGLKIELNGEAFYDPKYADPETGSESAAIFLQTLINAAVNSGVGMDAMVNAVNADGTINHLNLNGATVILGTAGDALGAQLVKATMTIGGVDTDFYITVDNASTLTDAKNAVTRVNDYLNINAKDGKLDISTRLPDKAYQAYLAAMLITGDTELTTVNDVTTKQAVDYIWDQIKPILEAEGLSLATMDNTMDKLGVNTNLAGNQTYTAIFDYFMRGYDRVIRTEIGTENADYSIQLAVDNVQNLIKKVNLPEAADGLIKDETLYLTVNFDLQNTETDYEAAIIDLRAAGVQNKIGFTTSLQNTLANANGVILATLTGDYNGSIVTDKNLYLDLAGKTVNGDVIGANIKIIDSSLGNTGAVTGTKQVYADYATNGLYEITENNGDIQIILKTTMLENRTRPSIQELAISIACDLALNYYSCASLSLGGNEIYAVEVEDLLKTLEKVNAEDVNAILDVPNFAGISAFVTQMIADLTNFTAMSSAIDNGDALVSYALATRNWDMNLKYIADGDYLSAEVVPSATNGKDQTVSIFLQIDSESAKDTAVDLLAGLGEIAKVDIELNVNDVNYASKTFTAIGNSHANVTLDLSLDPNYAVVMAALLANGGTAEYKAELLAALDNYLNNDSSVTVLKPVIEKAKTSDVVSALKSLYRRTDFNAIMTNLGLDELNEAKDLYNTYRILFVAAGYGLRTLDLTGGGLTLDHFMIKEEFGTYRYTRSVANSDVTFRGITAELQGEISGLVELKIFTDKPIHVADAEGSEIYVGDSLADAFAAAESGATITIVENVAADADVTVNGEITVVGAAKVDMGSYKALLDSADDKLILDAAWNVEATLFGYELKVEGFTYSLVEIAGPSYEGYVPAVTVGGNVAGVKAEEGYIYLDVIASGVKAEELLAVISHEADNADASVVTSLVNKDGAALTGEALVSNGSVITFTASSNTTDKTDTAVYTIVIMGDVNCDGQANSGDVTMMKNHYQTENVLTEEIQLLAMDMNQNGMLDAGDSSRIQVKYLLWENYVSKLS